MARKAPFVAWAALFCASLLVAQVAPGAEPNAEVIGVFQASWNHDASRVVVRTRSGEISLRDPTTRSPAIGDLGQNSASEAYVMSPDARRVLVGWASGGARVFETQSGTAVSPILDLAFRDATRAVFSPDAARVVVLEETAAAVFQVESGRRLATIPLALPAAEDEPGLTPAIVFTADEAHCFLMNRAGTVARYETQSWKPAGPAMRHPRAASAYTFGFAVSADGKWAATFDSPGENGPKGQLQVWDAMQGKALGKPIAAVNGMEGRFLPGTSRLLIQAGRGEARVLELPTLKTAYAIRPHDDIDGPSVEISPDGRWLLSWGSDRVIRLLDAANGAVKASQSFGVAISQVLLLPDNSGCLVILDNTAFGARDYHDHYVLKLGFPDFAVTHSHRLTDALHHATLSPDGRRLLLQTGPGDRERLLFLQASDLKLIEPVRP